MNSLISCAAAAIIGAALINKEAKGGQSLLVSTWICNILRYAMLGLGLEPENHTSEIYLPFITILLFGNSLPDIWLRV